MRLFRTRKKAEVVAIARAYAQEQDLPFSEPAFVRRSGLRRWSVTTAGQYVGGRGEFEIDDSTGEVDDFKIAC